MSRVAEPAKAGIGPSALAAGDATAGSAAPPASAAELAHKLTETREQQAATSEILRVISRSWTETQPVFDTIAAAALKLCGASAANVFTFDGQLLHLAAMATTHPQGADAMRAAYPRPASRDNAASRAVLTCAAVAIPDVLVDAEYALGYTAIAGGFRSALAFPLMRDGHPIGAIAVGRAQPGSFTLDEVALLETFAAQAVIAIENVRLFNELAARNRDVVDALAQQTAASDILRVISRSPTDAQPVFEIIAERAGELCGAEISIVSRVDGDLIRLAAVRGVVADGVKAIEHAYPLTRSSEAIAARAVRARDVVHVYDVLAEPRYDNKEAALVGGWRGSLAVPMMSDGSVVGAIFVARAEPGLFTDRQVELLKMFADQAVIALQNVRVFLALEARNRDMTEALARQTATSEILRVISRSPTDAQPVFEIIAERAVELCGAEISVVSRTDGEVIRLAALHGLKAEGVDALRRAFPLPMSSETITGRTVRSRAVVHVADVLADARYEMKQLSRVGQWRGCLGVPMLRDGEVIGAIFVARGDPGHFSDRQVELLKIFADQAVIAIQNVRLFEELNARTRQLMRSVAELKALGEVGRAVSSTIDLETVLGTIVTRATELTAMDGGAVYEYDESRQAFHLQTSHKLPDEIVAMLRSEPIRAGEGALGRLAVTPEPVQIPDIADEAMYQSRIRDMLIGRGYRSLLAVPLLREDRLLGGLVVNRNRSGEFAPEVIDLLQTFATQSALAIHNARLFREIQDKGRELERASRHKSEFLANMSHELRTPLNAIIGFSEVLSERMFGDVNEKQMEYLGDILESGRHLLSLINDILDLAKIEAGRLELESADFDLCNAIDNTLVLMRERAQRRGVALSRVVAEPPGMIRADERKIKQVLLNLLSNAIKFTPEGGRIDVLASIDRTDATVAVSDNGVGISAEDQAIVFEEFRQVGAATKKTEGTGLGLAISRKFIELHGGRMWVDSTIGRGSTFAFSVPLR